MTSRIPRMAHVWRFAGTIGIWLYDAQTGEELDLLTIYTAGALSVSLRPAPVWSVSFSPDGQTLASGSWKTTRLWDVGTGRLLRTLEGHTAEVRSVAFSLDGEVVESGSNDGTVRLWDVNTGDLLRTLDLGGAYVYIVQSGW